MTSRICNLCFQRHPIEDFAWRSRKRGRELRCKSCRNSYERQLRARHKTKQTDNVINKFVLNINRASTGQRIAAVVDEMISHFGGVDRFGQAW